MITPSQNGSNGRSTNGRFGCGNPGGPGNPHARRTAQIRSLLLESVTDDDLRAVVAKLIEMAKGGDLAATRELLDRLVGKPLTGVAVALQVDSMNVADEGGLSDRDSLARVTSLSEQIRNDPDYLKYLRARAVKEDALACSEGEFPRTREAAGNN
jgi:hypothetical protein